MVTYSEFCEHGCWHGNGCNRCEKENAFYWGLSHPFSKPYLWWSNKRRLAWIKENGAPWR